MRQCLPVEGKTSHFHSESINEMRFFKGNSTLQTPNSKNNEKLCNSVIGNCEIMKQGTRKSVIKKRR